ncbi:MFS general substrate transporter [Cylindrobasidium torrendii FP15055 ss-10]|uniref:MFS general substrate transporter n=1 Tax=Cylindrobasidium torrendii FP15055 ss-10 TaxID=1314674 RepID=A0A0D7BJ55_9AGAR|nr:MFS general substrate transporter [Cylindrobasidium torrendii FP15055 ss-10]
MTSTESEQPEANKALTKAQHRASLVQFCTLCFAFFLEGWNDGTTGPLLPVMQEYYGIGYTIVSILFVSSCVGFLLGAGVNVWMNAKLGFGKSMVIGSCFQVLAFAIEAPAPPFPVMVLGYFFAGLGAAIQDTQGNGFIGSLKTHKMTKLSILHSLYGAGAFVAPLVSTKFSVMPHWEYHFIVSTGIAVINTIILVVVFRGKRQEVLLAEMGQSSTEDESGRYTSSSVYRAIMGIKSVHFMSIFALIYIGTEVTLGGWIVTYIISERGGNSSAGYITSGFFGGVTVGRLTLIWVNKKIGEHRVVFLYSFIAIGLQLTVWFVPSIIENALAVSFIGVLLGPMFPILISHATRILPAWLLTGSVAWITGIGMSGSAALPFVTGLLASKYGIKSLQPLVVSMMCTMVGFWALVPRAQRRID